MDVYGKKPTDAAGEYFRASVWGWHPLWDYCEHVAPAITAKVRSGHTNDGDGLGVRDSVTLAGILALHVAEGRTADYVKARDAALAALPDEVCECCAGSGYRAEPPKTGSGTLPCNGCHHTGKKRPFATWYSLDVETVAEFAGFLAACGGFRIC